MTLKPHITKTPPHGSSEGFSFRSPGPLFDKSHPYAAVPVTRRGACPSTVRSLDYSSHEKRDPDF